MGESDTVRITFQAPVELDTALREAVGVRRGNSQSKFIREAIQEKLDQGKRNPDAELLLDRFNGLNERGRAWLLEAAAIAAGNDDTREIISRKTVKGE